MNHFCTKAGTTFVLLMCLLFLQTTSFAQSSAKISISSENISIKDALREVEKQSKMSVAYNESKLNDTRQIRLNLSGRSVDEALTAILSGTGFSYELRDEYIIILPEKKEQSDMREITGTVTDPSGAALAGATVRVEGTAIATATDGNGRYAIRVPLGSQLSYSYIGYENQSVAVGSRTAINMSLAESALVVDNVVVTALGIKRSEKALSYSVQQINADELTKVKDANLVNSLSGKVAGVVINTSSSGVGGAAKVVMRGTKSIEQSSNALYVIDGIPMFNLNGNGGTQHTSKGVTEAIADINPDDIESVSVLTGASAAALYGSNAANGAIIITTKKGSADRTTVTVSSNTEFTRPFVTPEFQNRYGTGDLTVEGSSLIKSWGTKLNNLTYQGYSPKNDFFETGTVFANNVALSTGTAKNQTYASVASVNSNGMIANNQYDRYNFTFRNTATFFDDKMTLDLGASYIIQKDQNMTNQGQYSNPITSAYLFPRGDDFGMVRVFERYDAARGINLQYWPQGPGDFTMQNPYWIAYRNLRNNDKQRYMLNAGLTYRIVDWLSVAGRVRVDNANNDFTEKMYSSTIRTLAGANGSFGITKTNDNQTYADVLASFNKKICDFSVTANVGASISDIRSDALNTSGPLREDGIPNLFNVFAIDDLQKYTGQSGYREQTQSVFASAEVGYRSMYYLTVTGRNDWASQLANSSETSFFYPSVGLSAVLSEIFRLPEQVNFLKLRGSFSSVGMPYPRSLTSLTYDWDNTNKRWKNKTHYPIYDLKPERTKSWEVGVNAQLFKHFKLDMSYYSADTYNQTFNPQISVSSKYDRLYVQTGNVRNSGVEATVSYNNKWRDFLWNSAVTFSYNKNNIRELVDGYVHPETGEVITKDRLEIGGIDRARFILKTGGSLGDLYAISDLKRDLNGNIYVSPEGKVQVEYGVPDIKLGNVFPKFNTAWRNDFSWKNLNASAVVSARIGGVVYSGTQAAMDFYGVSETSAAARDRGYVEINGTDRIDPQVWYSTIGAQGGVAHYYTYSATNVRLQEAIIGYTIPRSKFNNVMELTVSLVGRNLWMIYNKAPFDPEAVATTGNYYQGLDYFMVPAIRSLGFNVTVKF